MICFNMRHSINGEFRPLPPWVLDSFELHQRSAFDWKMVFQKKNSKFLFKKRQGIKLDSCIYLVLHPTKQSTQQIPPLLETGNLKGQGRRIVLMDLMDGMPQAFPPGFLEVYQLYHLESRWCNSHVLVYHGPLQIATELGSCAVITVYPTTQDNSHHQEYETFLVGNLNLGPKPSFATGILGSRS